MLSKAPGEHAFMGLQTEELDPAAFGYPSEGSSDQKALQARASEPIDAVVVCCNCEQALTYAVDLAAELNCPLFVYHDVAAGVSNDQARLATIWSLRVPRIDDIRAFHLPLRRDEPKPWPRLRTQWHRLHKGGNAHGGLSDLRTKAMTDMHVAGYQRVLMLDDDISVDPALVRAASRAMEQEGYGAVGFRVNDVVDGGVFARIFTLDSRLNLEVFKEQDWVRPPSGGAVLVDPSRCIAHSPPIYAEDWVVFHEMLRRGFRLAVMGEACQHNCQKFNEARIRAEVAGDVFSEGLSFAVNKNNQPLERDLWRRIIDVRLAKLALLRHFVDIIEDRARLSDLEPSLSGGDSHLKNREEVMHTIRSLERCFKTLKPRLFVDLYRQWREDERTFQAWLLEQPSSSSVISASEAQQRASVSRLEVPSPAQRERVAAAEVGECLLIRPVV